MGLDRLLSSLALWLLFQRNTVWFPTHTWQLRTAYNPNFKGFDPIWLLNNQTFIWCTNISRQRHTYIKYKNTQINTYIICFSIIAKRNYHQLSSLQQSIISLFPSSLTWLSPVSLFLVSYVCNKGLIWLCS